MITPGYAITATERVLPRLALDFTTAVTDPRVTTTRALNTATRVNASGLIETVNANLPRYDFDPTTLVCKGQLIEETRANLLINSVLDGGGAAPTSFTQPIGTGTSAPATSTRSLIGVAYSQSSTAQRPFIAQNVSLTNAVQYTISMIVEETSGLPNSAILTVSGFTMTQYYANGVAVTANAASVPGVLSAVFTNNVGTAAYSCRFGIGVATTATGTLRFSCPQLEAGAFATSYIPTTTTSLTRNADVVSMTGTNFSDWYNASEGTFAFLGDTISTASTKMALNINDGGTNNRLDYWMVNGSLGLGRFTSIVSGAATADSGNSGTPVVAANTPKWICAAYKQNSFGWSFAASTPGSAANGNVPTVDRLDIGNRVGFLFLNGHAQEILYWPQRCMNAEVQAFSKG